MEPLDTGFWLFGVFVLIFLAIVSFGFLRRNKQNHKLQRLNSESIPLPGWTEGETTRLLSSPDEIAEGYSLRPRLLNKIDTMVFHHIKRALPGHEILPRIRLGDILQMTARPSNEASKKVFQRLLATDVDFVVCDNDLLILAVIDLVSNDPNEDLRTTRLRGAKQSMLLRSKVNHISLDPLNMPNEEELRHRVMGSGIR